MSLYSQLADYVRGLTTYIHIATGVPTNRIIFSTPDIAKKRIVERETRLATTLTKTKEIDTFISFYFPFVQEQISDRSSVMQGFYGGKASAQKKTGWNINLDVPVTIDIWGGPTQDGKEYVFTNQMLLKHAMRSMQGVNILFSDPTNPAVPDPNLVTKDIHHPEIPYDANNFYLLQLQGITDNSRPEEQYISGANYRATFDFIWLVTFYNIPSNSAIISSLQEVIVEYEATGGDELRIEVDVVAP
jgi:hypothetical protein